jgi:hypothetical protein
VIGEIARCGARVAVRRQRGRKGKEKPKGGKERRAGTKTAWIVAQIISYIYLSMY